MVVNYPSMSSVDFGVPDFCFLISELAKITCPDGPAIHREQVPTAIRIPRPLRLECHRNLRRSASRHGGGPGIRLATTSAMSGKSPIHSSRRLVPGSRLVGRDYDRFRLTKCPECFR